MRFRRFWLAAALVGALLAAGSFSTKAQSAKEQELATMVGGSSEVTWQPHVPFSSLVLTVSEPGGQTYRQEFPAGSEPSFKLPRLADGVYTYELRFMPVLADGVKDALAAARERGNEDTVLGDLRSRGLLPTQRMVQSGAFTVQGGQLFAGGGTEPQSFQTGGKLGKVSKEATLITPQSVVTADDAIIQGSLCVGIDCVANENFGFDTIRIKENNTRIQFDDTSTSAGFPTNNWQIRANSSASGGANFLAFLDQGATGNSETGTIVFEVDAGAPANALKVASSGNVGFGTSNPVLDLHTVSGNTPAIRFEQDGSSGFTPQTWDVAGNETNFFVRDVTNGSHLPFKIIPGAPTNSLVIGANGNVGLGTSNNPSSKLTVNGVIEIADPGSMQPFGIQLPDGLVQATSGVADSLHVMGSTGTVDEDSTGLVFLNSFAVGVKDNSPGTVNLRYNLPVTPNLSSTGSMFRAFKIRYRESDGPGTSARILLVIRRSDIATGGNTAVFTFDSNNEASTGNAFVTLTKCDNTPDTDFDFTNNGYWVEVSITRSTNADLVQFGHLQIYKTNTCP
jgi:hypothetical protein